MKKRKTVTLAMAGCPGNNRFRDTKIVKKVPAGKAWADTCEKSALDFEEFLWHNAAANFYEKLIERMMERSGRR